MKSFEIHPTFSHIALDTARRPASRSGRINMHVDTKARRGTINQCLCELPANFVACEYIAFHPHGLASTEN